MSFVPEREQRLILDLLLGRLSEDEFYKRYPINPGDGSSVGLAMLRRALREQDSSGVEFGLHLGHRFGISREYVDVLLELAGADWHERHEDVVDGLAKLNAPAGAIVLYRAALAEHPYRDYDEGNALGRKSVRALGAVQTEEAVHLLGKLLNTENPILRSESWTQLTRIEKDSGSATLRAAAQDALRSANAGASK